MNEQPLRAGSLLLVDDDMDLCAVLGPALRRRGFRVHVAHDIGTAQLRFERDPPDVAILDLNLKGHSSLPLITALHACNPTAFVLMLSGYASVATAVEATKLGAGAYLTKPANIDEILKVLAKSPAPLPGTAPRRDMPSDIELAMIKNYRLVLRECDGNISAAARKLGMHRRSLQRKLKRVTN